MIDYFKIGLFDQQFRKLILENPLLNFEARVKDAEIISQTATYKNMKVCVNDRQTIISGSLHKFWDSNGTNSSDFPMEPLRPAIIELSHLFGFNPADAVILGLEYGVNVIPVAPTDELISRAICYDCRHPFESMQGITGAGNGKEARLSNYRIKIYDKGLQYGLSEPLLRFECKTKRSIDLKETGAHTLQDLTNSEVLRRLGQELISRFESILFHEKLDETLMSHKEQLFYHDAANPYLWQSLKPWKRNDNKAKFAKLLEKHGGGSLKSNLRKQIADKWNELQKCNDFAGFPENISEEKCNDFTPFNESELTAAKLENSNDFALLEGENVTSHRVSAEENPIQGRVGKSVIHEAESPCADLVKIVPDGRRRQQENNQLQIDWAGSDRPTGSDRLTGAVPIQKNIPPAEAVSNGRRPQPKNCQLQIDWTASGWPTDSDRLTDEMPTQKIIPPAEEIADRRRRQKNREDLAKADRSDTPVSNQLITRNEHVAKRDEYPQGKESVITLYLSDECDEEEVDTNIALSTDRRLSPFKNCKNNSLSALWSLLKKESNQAKRRRYRSAAKMYNDFKMDHLKLPPTRQVKF